MNRTSSLVVMVSIFALAACGKPAERAEPPAGVDKAAPMVHQAEVASAGAMSEAAIAESMAAGETAYLANCGACHQKDGNGLAKAFPPLAGADYLMDDKERSISVVLNGLQGPITVNGVEYNSLMPPMNQLDDQTVANILTYVRNSWGNQGEPVIPAEVAAVRGGSSAQVIHPDSSESDVMYHGAPVAVGEARMITTPGAPAISEAEYHRATKVFFERCAGCHGEN